MRHTAHSRAGISLMEVLISIGVIALGIFGVSALIPAAQFRVAQGTAKARQAALGQRAIAEFRIRDMGAPGTARNALWRTKSGLAALFNPTTKQLRRRGFCIDPLGMAGTSNDFGVFPVGGNAGLAMPRVTLSKIYHPSMQAELATELAREICFLEDDLVFHRPEAQQMQPNRQYFVEAVRGGMRPVKTYAQGAMSWFATVSPSTLGTNSDEFILSIVVVQDRVVKRLPAVSAADQLTEENFALATSSYPGEVTLVSGTPGPMQVGVADLAVGDWLLLVRSVDQTAFNDASSHDKVYRWTRIVGASESPDGTGRSFSIASDDFLKPKTPARAIFMRGVRAVYEKTIRIENSSSWN